MSTITEILNEHGIDDPLDQVVLSNEIHYEVTGNDLKVPELPRNSQELRNLLIDWARILYEYQAHQAGKRKPILPAVNRTLQRFQIPFSIRTAMRSQICSDFGKHSGKHRRKITNQEFFESVQPPLSFPPPSTS